jgi:hypothetical protein
MKFLKKPLAQSPQTPETPKRHKHCRHHDLEFSLRLAQRGIGALMHCSYRSSFDHFSLKTNLDAPHAIEI